MMREFDGGASSSPVIAPTFVAPGTTGAATGIGYGEGGLLGTAVLLGLLGNNRGGYGYGNGDGNCSGDSVLGQNVSNLRKDVADNAAEVHKLGNEIQQAFAAQTASQASDFRNLDNQICMVEKAALEAKYEGKIQTLESTNLITDKIDTTHIATTLQLNNLSTQIATKFCDVEHMMERNTNALSLQAERNHNATTLQIEREFNKLEEHRLRDEIAELRAQLECQRRERDAITNSLLMSQQTNNILNAVDSQLQRQTSQIVQFGTGNLATPAVTSTNNQVS